jgi:hypothetical protein
MKKLSAAVSSKTPLSNNPDDNSRMRSKAKHHLMKLVAAFQNFISASSAFIEELMSDLQALLTQSGRTSDRNVFLCIFKCLIFLGDLARYRELHSESSTKDWAAVEVLYKRAITIMPNMGNPHNQLAVLAAYAESDFIAIYHYCRSVLVEQPFSVGVENLKLAYEKLIKNSAGLFNQQRSTSDGKSANAKTFLTKIVTLHGILFLHALKALGQSSKFSKIRVDDSKIVLTLDEVSEQLPDLIAEFDVLISQCKLSETVLLRLLIICIFSVHFSSQDQLYFESIVCSTSSNRTSAESISMSILMGLIVKIGNPFKFCLSLHLLYIHLSDGSLYL